MSAANHQLKQNRQVYSVEGADAGHLINPTIKLLCSTLLGVTCLSPHPVPQAPLCSRSRALHGNPL